VLRVRKVVIATEHTEIPLTGAQALAARDAVAKHIYGRMFDWYGEVALSFTMHPWIYAESGHMVDVECCTL